MNFEKNESQKALQASARAFAKKFIEPEAREFDEKSLFPLETFRGMGRKGSWVSPCLRSMAGVIGGPSSTALFAKKSLKPAPPTSTMVIIRPKRCSCIMGPRNNGRDFYPS